MPIHLVIGLVDVRQPQGAPESAGRDAVWRDRPKIELDVEESDALASVLKRASEEFARAIPELPGAPMAFHVAFHDGGDDDPPPPLRSTHGVPLVDENGAASWGHRYADVTYADLLRSQEMGALGGDPTRPYVYSIPPRGNGVLPSWPDLLHYVQVLKQVAEILSVPGGLYGSYKALQALTGWLGRSEEAVTDNADEWEQRGAGPHSMMFWLDDRTWASDQLAGLLGCTVLAAEAVLRTYGFGQASDGLWRLGEGEEAKFMLGNRRLFLGTAGRHELDEALRKELDQRLRHLLDQGKAPADPDVLRIVTSGEMSDASMMDDDEPKRRRGWRRPWRRRNR